MIFTFYLNQLITKKLCKKICTTKILTCNYYIITYSNWLYTDGGLFCSYILYDANSHIFCTQKIELRHRFIGNFITTCTQTTGLNLETYRESKLPYQRCIAILIKQHQLFVPKSKQPFSEGGR